MPSLPHQVPVIEQASPRERLQALMSDPVRPSILQPIPRQPRREWYRGPEPEGLTKFLLEHYVMHRRDPEAKPPGRAYWADEVQWARRLASEWASALFDGLTFEDIVEWVRADWPLVDHVGGLHRAGIRPGELGWSYEDRGAYPLGERLARGLWTTEMVVNEVQRRRELR